MVEDLIKLFPTRADRLPQTDDAQTFREAIEKGIEQVPVAGPITTFVMSRFWAPSAARRLEGWLREVADDFDRHCEGCSSENLMQDEAFISDPFRWRALSPAPIRQRSIFTSATLCSI